MPSLGLARLRQGPRVHISSEPLVESLGTSDFHEKSLWWEEALR